MAFIVLGLGDAAGRRHGARRWCVGVPVLFSWARWSGWWPPRVPSPRLGKQKDPPGCGRSARRGVLVSLVDNEGAGGHGSLRHLPTVGRARRRRKRSSG